MPSRKASEISVRFLKKVSFLNLTRMRIEKAYQDKYLHLRDAESSYAGLFLQAVLAYEAAVELLVLGLVVHPNGIKSRNTQVRPRIQVRSYAHALELAAGPGRDFADWIGKEQLLDRANMFLREGRPFSSLSDADWSYVAKSRYIRNAIAHPSKSALDKFTKKVIGSTPLPPRERTVYGYLRGAGAAGQTRWELYVAGLSVVVGLVAN